MSTRAGLFLTFWMVVSFSVPSISIGQAPPSPAPAVDEVPTTRPFDEAEAAGLPKGTGLRVLSLQEAYWVASLREQLPKGDRAAFPDAKGLATLANQAGIDDYARFRAGLLSAGENEGSADPTSAYFELLRSRQLVEMTIQGFKLPRAVLDQMKRGLGRGSGVSLTAINQLELSLWKSRSALADRELAYRDALDAFKVRLGISPITPLVPDSSLIAPIRTAFDALDRWSDQGDLVRNRDDLPNILDGLPKATDLTIDGLSLVDVATSHPETLAKLLAAATTASTRARARARAAESSDGLRLRSRLRRLGRIALDVEIGKTMLLRSLIERDSALRMLNAPPMGANVDTAELIRDNTRALIDADSACFEIRSRLVRDWSEGHSLRVALYRDLGSIPQEDWNAFLQAFSGPIGGPKAP